ncbi:hypothetical protein H9P43_004290 [Blastocladiella emersonii ATCC 22665]|nr:hypothetical protein H9P43_004290 [Blastocladiella emersonii ATCC 22665]
MHGDHAQGADPCLKLANATADVAASLDAAASTAKRPQRKRKRWTDEEVEQLIRGVQKHGVGAWSAIVADPDIVLDSQRSPVDLKDKWRVLTTRRPANAPPLPFDISALPRATASSSKRERDPSPERATAQPAARVFLAPTSAVPASSSTGMMTRSRSRGRSRARLSPRTQSSAAARQSVSPAPLPNLSSSPSSYRGFASASSSSPSMLSSLGRSPSTTPPLFEPTVAEVQRPWSPPAAPLARSYPDPFLPSISALPPPPAATSATVFGSARVASSTSPTYYGAPSTNFTPSTGFAPSTTNGFAHPPLPTEYLNPAPALGPNPILMRPAPPPAPQTHQSGGSGFSAYIPSSLMSWVPSMPAVSLPAVSLPAVTLDSFAPASFLGLGGTGTSSTTAAASPQVSLLPLEARSTPQLPTTSPQASLFPLEAHSTPHLPITSLPPLSMDVDGEDYDYDEDDDDDDLASFDPSSLLRSAAPSASPSLGLAAPTTAAAPDWNSINDADLFDQLSQPGYLSTLAARLPPAALASLQIRIHAAIVNARQSRSEMQAKYEKILFRLFVDTAQMPDLPKGAITAPWNCDVDGTITPEPMPRSDFFNVRYHPNVDYRVSPRAPAALRRRPRSMSPAAAAAAAGVAPPDAARRGRSVPRRSSPSAPAYYDAYALPGGTGSGGPVPPVPPLPNIDGSSSGTFTCPVTGKTFRAAAPVSTDEALAELTDAALRLDPSTRDTVLAVLESRPFSRASSRIESAAYWGLRVPDRKYMAAHPVVGAPQLTDDEIVNPSYDRILRGRRNMEAMLASASATTSAAGAAAEEIGASPPPAK